jgi:predicted nuclease of predicted toxin-antitoxin system
MHLFCDQNIMVETVEFLRQQGHDVSSTREAGLAAAPDEEVMAFAVRQDRILLTYNADFGDIRLFPVGTHAGIIRLRVTQQTAEALHPVLKSAIGQLADKDLSGKLVTITKTAIRIRGQA